LAMLKNMEKEMKIKMEKEGKKGEEKKEVGL
jgi:hypothetical protein